MIHKQFFFLFVIAGDNGRIEYIITAGDDNGDFQIVQNGTILTKREVDRETKSTYNLVVTAKDCAKEPEKRLSSTVQVIIIILFYLWFLLLFLLLFLCLFANRNHYYFMLICKWYNRNTYRIYDL